MNQFSWILGILTMFISLLGWSMVLRVSVVCGVIQRTGWGPGVMGKLRRAGRKAIHSWPGPLCIIVPSDPVNILNHQSKQSDPPANTQGEALHSAQLPRFSGLCGPSETSTHTWPQAYRLLLSSCPVQNRCGINPHFMLSFRNARLANYKAMPSLFIFLSLSVLFMYSWVPVREKLKELKEGSEIHLYWLCLRSEGKPE